MNKWMKNIPDNTLLSDINLPGTHNSATKYVQFAFISQCQKSSIYEQLNIGVRFLDIRVEEAGNRLKLVHSFCNCYSPADKKKLLFSEDVVEDCSKFLKENPSETILFSLKRDNGSSQEKVFDLFFNKHLSDKIWYKENRIPSLGEARGKIVLIRRCCIDSSNSDYSDNNTGLNFSTWKDQSKLYKGGFDIIPIPTSENSSAGNYLLQDMYKLKPKDKWEKAVLPLLEKTIEHSGFVLNFFTASSGLITPKIYARYLYKRFNNISLKAAEKYGCLILDFPTENICKKIILSNFK